MKNRIGLALTTLVSLAGTARAQSYSESFDNVDTSLASGWAQQNNSSPIGPTNYFQGGEFPAVTPTGSFLASNFNNTAAGAATGNTISNWFMSPTRTLRNGDTFAFWTRVGGNTLGQYPDRLQLRLSQNGASLNCGPLGDAAAVGDFTTLLLTINPNLNHVIDPPPPSGNPPIVDGYPGAWRQYTVTLSGLPGGGVSGRIAFRYFVTDGGFDGVNSNYIGIDNADYASVIDPTGACCLTETSCVTMTANNCAGNAGLYRGDGLACGSVNCASSGACCREDGTCAVLSTFACSAAGGIYRGDNQVCASAACSPFAITGDDETTLPDVGDTVATSKSATGYGQPITKIHGYIGLSDRADIYRLAICNRTTFRATTVGNGNTLDTELAIFDSTGKGISLDDDTGNGTAQATSQSIVTGLYAPSNGYYYLAISTFNNTVPSFNMPLDSSGATIFVEPSPWNGTTNPIGGAGWPEWPPNGTSATKILSANPPAWSHEPDAFGNYTIALTGACFLGCYANCDGSSIAPILNANDFQCFLNSFSGASNGYGYANCDASTALPVLNANDFQCFLNSFAAGCLS